jgi:hypothetical protein
MADAPLVVRARPERALLACRPKVSPPDMNSHHALERIRPRVHLEGSTRREEPEVALDRRTYDRARAGEAAARRIEEKLAETHAPLVADEPEVVQLREVVVRARHDLDARGVRVTNGGDHPPEDVCALCIAHGVLQVARVEHVSPRWRAHCLPVRDGDGAGRRVARVPVAAGERAGDERI